jgi:hypothetical protein
MTIAFDRMASITASTKRSPAAIASRITAPQACLASVKILPLMPAPTDVLQRYTLASPREPYVTYTQGSPDIQAGDILVVSAVEYPIRAVGRWPSDLSCLEILVDKVK